MFFTGFDAMLRCLDCVALGYLGMVRASLVVGSFVMFSRFFVMSGCPFVVLGSFGVMLLNSARVRRRI
jgi:hypothetical protein